MLPSQRNNRISALVQDPAFQNRFQCLFQAHFGSAVAPIVQIPSLQLSYVPNDEARILGILFDILFKRYLYEVKKEQFPFRINFQTEIIKCNTLSELKSKVRRHQIETELFLEKSRIEVNEEKLEIIKSYYPLSVSTIEELNQIVCNTNDYKTIDIFPEVLLSILLIEKVPDLSSFYLKYKVLEQRFIEIMRYFEFNFIRGISGTGLESSSTQTPIFISTSLSFGPITGKIDFQIGTTLFELKVTKEKISSDIQVLLYSLINILNDKPVKRSVVMNILSGTMINYNLEKIKDKDHVRVVLSDIINENITIGELIKYYSNRYLNSYQI